MLLVHAIQHYCSIKMSNNCVSWVCRAYGFQCSNQQTTIERRIIGLKSIIIRTFYQNHTHKNRIKAAYIQKKKYSHFFLKHNLHCILNAAVVTHDFREPLHRLKCCDLHSVERSLVKGFRLLTLEFNQLLLFRFVCVSSFHQVRTHWVYQLKM